VVNLVNMFNRDQYGILCADYRGLHDKILSMDDIGVKKHANCFDVDSEEVGLCEVVGCGWDVCFPLYLGFMPQSLVLSHSIAI